MATNDMSYDDRLAANEVIFREHNERILELVKSATVKVKNRSPSLHFYCECSSLFCMEQVDIGIDAYVAAHRGKKYFVIKPGHEQKKIEHVIEKRKGYSIVEKYEVPPRPEEV